MNRLSLTIMVVFLIAAPVQIASGQSKASTPPLTNNEVVSMVKAGLPVDVIIAKVQRSECAFDTSPITLEKLKAAGVPETVILAMVKVPNASASAEELSGQVTAQDTKAVVHFYRERAFQAALRKIPINLDGIKIADLVNGRQFTIRLDPGKHVLRSKTKLKAISVNMKPGQEYYFRAEFSQGFMKNEWVVVQVANEQGAADIQRLKPLDMKDIAAIYRTAETK